MNVDELIDQVAIETGLRDFGHPSFRDGLEHLVDAVEREAHLNPIGKATFAATMKGFLATRARVTDWHHHHPAAMTAAVEAPIFVIGASRTGTTALSHLLSVDPANRSLLGWEANQPLPAPAAATYRSDPRFLAALAAAKNDNPLAASFKAMHYDPPDSPVECLVLFNQCFASLAQSVMYVVPSYDTWLLAADMKESYKYHRQVLQLLQSKCPGHWQLKSPQHSLFLDDLVAVYPDARFVQIHRDPVKAIASTCSLVRTLSSPFTDTDHIDVIAPHWADLVVQMIGRILDFRERRPELTVHDMPYQQLVSDPVAAVREMYTTFGRELTDEAAQAIRGYSEREAQYKYGMHSYSLSDAGLSRESLDERLAPYYARHAIVKENA